MPSQVLRALSERLKLASTMATLCSRSTPKLHQERSQKVEIQNPKFSWGGGGGMPPDPPASALHALYYSARCVHLSKATVDQSDHFKSDGYGLSMQRM